MKKAEIKTPEISTEMGLGLTEVSDDYKIPVCKVCGFKKGGLWKENGKTYLVHLKCKCETEKFEKKMERLEKNTKELDKRRSENMLGNIESLKDTRFSDLETNKAVKVGKNYVKNWKLFKSEGLGILFWGDCGTGKTATAAAIANEIREQYGETTLIINIPTLINNLTSVDFSQKKSFIEELNRPSLVVLDDFGVERSSEFVLEATYNLINDRYLSNKPMIVTTNLPYDFFNGKETDLRLDSKRCYSRINERCQAMRCDIDYRKKKALESKESMKKLLLEGI